MVEKVDAERINNGCRSGASQIRAIQLVPRAAGQVVAMSFVMAQAKSIRDQGIDTFEVFLEDRTSLSGVIKGIRRLRGAITRHKPDIIHAHYGTVTAFVAALVKRRAQLVITYRGSDLNPDGTSGFPRKITKLLMSQFAALRADRIITVSEQLCQKLWWQRDIVHVIPSGVDMDLYCPVDKNTARQQLGWARDEKIIVINVSKNPTNKRLDIAEALQARLTQRVGGVRLHVLAGETDPAEVPIILSASDCLLMVSNFEGSPNIVKEAMACNLPVVSFDVGDVRDRFGHVDGCWIVPRDMAALEEATLNVLLSGKRAAGRQAVSTISTQKVAAQILDVYALAVNGKGNL